MGFNLGRALRVRFDGHTLGNVLKNAAPVAGTLVGGPAGLALAGLGGAAGQAVLPGSNIGDIFRSGVTGASEAGLGQAAKSGLSGLLSGGSSTPAPIGGVQDVPGVPSPSQISGALDAAKAVPGPFNAGALGGSPSLLARGGNFLENHASAVGMGLKGLGDVANAPSQNRYRAAQTHALDVDTQAAEDERRRRLAMQDALDPIRRALAGQLNQPRSPIAPDPYAPIPLAA